MTPIDIAIVSVPVLVLIIWSGIFVHQVGLKNLRQKMKERMDQSEWYDEDGNHIYYDRKYIRYQQQLKKKAAASQK